MNQVEVSLAATTVRIFTGSPRAASRIPGSTFVSRLSRGLGAVRTVTSPASGLLLTICCLLANLFVAPTPASAQGLLTVTPTRSTTTLAGNGTASSSTLASPSAVAYDTAGNLYIADTNNHVVRELVNSTGASSIVAGTGIAGFGGDGAAATAAQLDTPTGIAVDAAGNIYIADAHNQRIRKVSAGIITTIAGTGAKGFAGDGAAGTAATLNLPSAIAVDAAGNIYIADTNNQRIRELAAGIITTIAGSGAQGFAGDGAAATAATLDSPTGVAVDAAGDVYIADRHNQRIREVSGGNISTLAGSGTPTFAGSFAGDGAASTAATLAKPTGVSVDAAGNVYIADTNNQRVRQLGGGVIATIAGSGQQGFGADGGPSTAAILNAPRTVAPDAQGNLAVADALDQRIRSGTLPTLTFTGQAIGVPGPAQSVTLANTGTAPIVVASVAPSPGFVAAAGGTCPAPPIMLAPGASCTQNFAASPSNLGGYTGSVVFSGAGVINQTVLLVATGTKAATTTTVTSNVAQPVVGQAITFTAQVQPAGTGTPTGTVQFFANGVAIGAAVQITSAGLAALTTSFNVAGVYAITAVYSGDALFAGSNSAMLSQTVLDFTLALSANSPGGAGQTVLPGQTATYSFAVSPLGGAFPYPVAFTASGLPPGAIVTFTPQTLTPGASAQSFTMAVKTAVPTGTLRRQQLFGGATLALGMLLLPFSRRMRRSGRRLQPLVFGWLLLAGLSTLALTGCGSGAGFFGQLQQTYNIVVTSTATASNGATLQRSTTVQLTVE